MPQNEPISKQTLFKLVHNHGVRFWDELVARTVWNMRAYNHSTAGFSPFEILFSQTPRIQATKSDIIIPVFVAHMNNWEEAWQKMLLRPDYQQENATFQFRDYVLVKRHQRQALGNHRNHWNHQNYHNNRAADGAELILCKVHKASKSHSLSKMEREHLTGTVREDAHTIVVILLERLNRLLWSRRY